MQNPTIKLSYFDTVCKALQLVKMSFRGAFIYAFCMSLINQLISLDFVNTFALTDDKITLTRPVLFGVYLFLMFATILFGNSLILVRQNAILHHQQFGFMETMRPILNRLPGIFVSGIAFTLLSIVGMGLHIIPGVLFMTCFYLYLPSLIFAHKKAFEAWRYSFSLIKKQFFSTLALVLTSLILLWIPPAVASLLGGVLNSGNTYFGLEITGMILLISLILLLMNAMNIVWFYLLHQNKQ